MSVVSRPSRKKSWQTAHEVVSLLEVLAAKESEVANRLEMLRKAHGLSQEAAAHELGISYRQWQRWESGASEPRASNLARISERFDVPVSELVGDGSGSQFDRIEARMGELGAAVAAIEDQIRLLRADLAIRDAEELQRIEGSVPASLPARRRQQR